MRNLNQTQTTNNRAEFLDLLDELNQHILQAKALVNYMGSDISQNNGFTVTDEVIDGMLWTLQTLLNNAENVSDKMSEWNKQGGQIMAKNSKTPKKLSMAESYQFIANHSDEWAERLQTKLDDLRVYSNALKAYAEQGDVEQCRDTFEALYHTWGGAGDLLNILALPMFEEWFKQHQTKLQQEQGGSE